MSTADAGRVIVVGSINVDVVLRLPALPGPGETVLGGELTRHHGGKGANQAVAAARAGGHVHMIGAVGATDGTESVRELAAEGIEVTQVQRVAGPTGLAAVLVDEHTSENMIAVASGANALVTPEVVTAALAATGLRPADVVVLSFELPGPSLERTAEICLGAGARLLVNPAPAQPDLVGVLAGALATPNEHELAVYVRAEQSERGRRTLNSPPTLGPFGSQAALALSERTGGPVLVTLGARGALLAADGQTEHFAGYRMEAVDTTGAGDTLTGVLAAGLAAGYPLREAVQRAVAAAALSVTKAGARAGMPTAAEIDALAGTVS
jgi:ribokinase